MVCKLIIFGIFVMTVRGSAVAPIAAPVVAAKFVDSEIDPNPQYTYAYDVQDSLTGDSKNQFETRNGDIVQGRYSLIEADGTRRIVDYTADPINGFNAVVRREPVVAAPVVAAPAPIIAARAPVVAAPAPVISARAPVVAAPAPIIAAAPVPTLAKFAAPVLTSPFARVAAPLFAPAPITRIASPFAAPLVHAPQFARFAAPVAAAPVPAPLVAAPIARYAAPLTYPFAAKVAAPFSYPGSFAPAAYTNFYQ